MAAITSAHAQHFGRIWRWKESLTHKNVLHYRVCVCINNITSAHTHTHTGRTYKTSISDERLGLAIIFSVGTRGKPINGLHFFFLVYIYYPIERAGSTNKGIHSYPMIDDVDDILHKYAIASTTIVEIYIRSFT